MPQFSIAFSRSRNKASTPVLRSQTTVAFKDLVALGNTQNSGFKKFGASFKTLFAKRKGAERRGKANIAPDSKPVYKFPAFGRVSREGPVLIDPEALEILQDLFEALHDPSLLDAHRHHRYGLMVLIVSPETMCQGSDLSAASDIASPLLPSKRIEVQTPDGMVTVSLSDGQKLTTEPILIQDLPTFAFSSARKLPSSTQFIPIPKPAQLEAPSEPRWLDAKQDVGEHTSSDDIIVGRPQTLKSSTESILVQDAPTQSLQRACRLPYSTQSHNLDQVWPLPLSELRRMDAHEFQVLRFLGGGTTGNVYHVMDRVSKEKCALKAVSKDDKSEYVLSILLQERDINVKLADCPWFVKMTAAFHDQSNLYFVMESYPTDLDSEIIRWGKLDPERVRFYAAEIFLGLEELHKRGIIHRDVKAANVLIDRDGHAVLADFGLSKDFHDIPDFSERVCQPYWAYLRSDTTAAKPRDPTELRFVSQEYRGSELEMAPEVHLGRYYSFGIDHWSLAVVIIWMLCGHPPFYVTESEFEDGSSQDVKTLGEKIAEDPITLFVDDEVDEVTRDLVGDMLEKDPKNRILEHEIPGHPYFAGVDWNLMKKRMVPAPWVPGQGALHVYQATPEEATFTPGEPYSDEVEDPCPDFYFIAEGAHLPVLELDGINGDHYDSDSDSSSTLTKINLDSDPSATSPALSSSSWTDSSTQYTGISTSLADDNQSRDHWDYSHINRPSVKPSGPGAKQWLGAQDLVKIQITEPSSLSSVVPASHPALSYPPIVSTVTIPSSASSFLSGLHVDHDCTLTSPPCFEASLLPSPTPVLDLNIEDNGFLSKIKSYISKAFSRTMTRRMDRLCLLLH